MYTRVDFQSEPSTDFPKRKAPLKLVARSFFLYLSAPCFSRLNGFAILSADYRSSGRRALVPPHRVHFAKLFQEGLKNG